MRKSVIFDLYETLITENHPEWHVRKSSPAQRLGMDDAIFKREWSSRYVDRMTGTLPSYAAALRALCSTAGVKPPSGEIERLEQERAQAKARPFERIDPSVLAMLDALRAQGYAIGVISNCTFDEVAAWDASPLASRVDQAVFSCAVGLVKPNPAIYALMCKRLGSDPADAVFIGDGMSDELQGAQAAGINAIWATWFIESWPWDWVGNVANMADGFPRCRSLVALPALVTDLLDGAST